MPKGLVSSTAYVRPGSTIDIATSGRLTESAPAARLDEYFITRPQRIVPSRVDFVPVEQQAALRTCVTAFESLRSATHTADEKRPGC